MRKLFTFHGGIHPPENKSQSLAQPIREAGIPSHLILPLSQHIGAPAKPVVTVGERVLKGQLLASARGTVSAAVHAPTSGVVEAIEDRQIAHPSGLTSMCIVLASDGKDEWITLAPTLNYLECQPEEIVARIQAAGIAGMGGAGFPTAAKVNTPPERKVETLIINGTECEPYITADDILMQERPQQIIAGVKILQHLLQPGETLIGIEDNKPEAIAALQTAAEGSDIEVVSFPTKYPSGGEKQLIEILTGKQVPSGGLPLDIGVICQNIGSVVAVEDAITLGQPLISRITTVTGEAVTSPGNFQVLLGTPMRFLLEQAGYLTEKNERLVMGGPMMGFAVPDLDVPIVKTTNCLLAPTPSELPNPAPAQACIRCGLCEQACPASLLPQQMFWFAQGKEFEKLEQHNLFDCIECGACSWVCPSNIPLVQYYRASKSEILFARQEHKKAEQSRIRFEARQQRLERGEAEKAAKRAARKQAAEQRARDTSATGQTGEDDPVQAAIDRAKAKKAAQQAAGSSSESEKQRLEDNVASIRQRLEKANQKLTQAEAENSEHVDALRSGVDKTRAKLEAAEQALAALSPGDKDKVEAEPPVDAAAAAIAKAMAARTAKAELDPAEQAKEKLRALELRLQKTRDRLTQSRSEDADEKVIEALEASIHRLQDKITTAKADLPTAEAD